MQTGSIVLATYHSHECTNSNKFWTVISITIQNILPALDFGLMPGLISFHLCISSLNLFIDVNTDIVNHTPYTEA
jgi:hypothetical protein